MQGLLIGRVDFFRFRLGPPHKCQRRIMDPVRMIQLDIGHPNLFN
jgi:hypothetical protein